MAWRAGVVVFHVGSRLLGSGLGRWQLVVRLARMVACCDQHGGQTDSTRLGLDMTVRVVERWVVCSREGQSGSWPGLCLSRKMGSCGATLHLTARLRSRYRLGQGLGGVGGGGGGEARRDGQSSSAW